MKCERNSGHYRVNFLHVFLETMRYETHAAEATVEIARISSCYRHERYINALITMLCRATVRPFIGRRFVPSRRRNRSASPAASIAVNPVKCDDEPLVLGGIKTIAAVYGAGTRTGTQYANTCLRLISLLPEEADKSTRKITSHYRSDDVMLRFALPVCPQRGELETSVL